MKIAESFTSSRVTQVCLTFYSLRFLHFAIIGLILMMLLLITGEYAFHLIIILIFFTTKHFGRFSERPIELGSGHTAHYHPVCECDTHLCKKVYNITARVHKSFYEFGRILFLLQTYGIPDSVLVKPVNCFFFFATRTQRRTMN